MRNENTYLSPTTKGCKQHSNIKPIGLSPEAFSHHNTGLHNDRHCIDDNVLKNPNKNLDKNLTYWQLSSGLLNRDTK